MSFTRLKSLKFSNMFSYGENNELQLNDNSITQLTAVNGSGKSSVALILQELLYNKNIKNIKKGDILNRWSGSKAWNGSVYFDTDGKDYCVEVNRVGAATKVKLFEDGVDISEHKVLDTYKKISSIIGLNFETFSQLSYQSSTDLLDFLKATDANRKKFLINLFNLERYLEIGERVKSAATAIDKEIAGLQGELRSIEDYLTSVKLSEYKSEQSVPDIDNDIVVRIAEITSEITNANDIVRKIDKNNMYIQERDSLSFDLGLQAPTPFEHTEALNSVKSEVTVLQSELSKLQKEKNSIKILDKCPSCGQAIDNNHLIAMKAALETKICECESQLVLKQNNVDTLSAEYELYNKSLNTYNQNQKYIQRFEQLTQLIDENTPTKYPDVKALNQEKDILTIQLNQQEQSRNKAIQYNNTVSAHNAKIDAVKEQINEFKVRQAAVKQAIVDKSEVSTSLGILKKAFSTSGIVAFKLESLTKELENTINRYLASLSDGQFQVEFSLNKEKLNISIINNGISSPIETMSGGEFSRIQTSILLAIRNLLSKLGGSSINLLFLDEITGVLDTDGKEKLIEVLQEEENLNVFLISHDFTHPLIDKISIIKQNNISCIQS